MPIDTGKTVGKSHSPLISLSNFFMTASIFSMDGMDG